MIRCPECGEWVWTAEEPFEPDDPNDILPNHMAAKHPEVKTLDQYGGDS